LTAEAAAALLGTSTAILSLWEERFGFPVPDRTADGQPLYPDEMMIALRDALGRELSIASAITEARRAQSSRRLRRRLTRPRGRSPRCPGSPEEAR
jgi:DNA-binding transcriptional MerR regulator